MAHALKSEGDFTVGDVVKMKGGKVDMVVDSFVRQPGGGQDTATESKIRCMWQGTTGSVLEHEFSPHHLEKVSGAKHEEPRRDEPNEEQRRRQEQQRQHGG